MPPLLHLLIYACAFYAIWFGANLIVTAITKFSRRLRISNFSASFFVLGILTSIPEFAVGLTSITAQDPEIFVGNLIGGIIIIFLLIIPLLAFLGNGIRLSHKLKRSSIMVILLVCFTPSLLIADKRITNFEALILISMYSILFLVLRHQRGFMLILKQLSNTKSYTLKDLFTVLIGVFIVFISSQFILEQTLYFSHMANIPPIILSVLVLSLGTNLPELSLAIKGVLSGQKDIALGNYLGSATANSLLLGILSLVNKGDVITNHGFQVNSIFVGLGLVGFYVFSRSKNTISRNEGMILLLVYGSFISYWILR